MGKNSLPTAANVSMDHISKKKSSKETSNEENQQREMER